ncbi:MAG: hypothetical protein K1X74_20330 [Pirellulales bacterium]|nr:hypothetical protein [Pirellulales bacterium]
MRREWALVLILLAAIAAIRALELRPGHEWGCDFAMYIMHAENLVEGVPYAETGYIYNPSYGSLGPKTYPPGTAMFLAPLYAAFGLNLWAFKLEMMACLLGSLALIYLNFRRIVGPWPAAAIVATFGLNHYMYDWVNSVGSDLPFILLVYAWFLAVAWAYRVPRGAPPHVGLLALSGLLAAAAYSTRSLGLVLVPMLLVYDFGRNGWKPGWRSLVALAIFCCLALLQTLFLHSDNAYISFFQFKPDVIVYHLFEYTKRFIVFWNNGYVPALTILVFLIMLPAALVGFLARLVRGPTVYELVPMCYMLLVIVFPFYQGARYIVPLLPLYLLYIVVGWQILLESLPETFRRRVVAVLVLFVAGSYAARLTTLDLGPMREGIGKPETVALFDEVRGHTPADAVVVFLKPRAMALFTGRKSTVWNFAEHDQQLWDYWKSIHATHVVVAERDEPFLLLEDPKLIALTREFVARQPERFERQFGNGDFTLYRIR